MADYYSTYTPKDIMNNNNDPISTNGIADISDGRSEHVPHWTIKFNEWRRAHIPDYIFMITLAIIIGVLAGCAAYIFKLSISFISNYFIGFIKDHTLNWWIILTPVAGILLTGIFTRYIIRTNLTHGVAQLIRDLKHKTYRLRHNIVISPIIGGSITLGMGGSAGAEGPIAYTGAAIGSNVGQFFGLKPEMLKILIGCGTSAGIAGIFSAPIGGLMFALELLHMDLTVNAILAATVSCMTSFLTIYTLKGFHTDLFFSPLADFDLSLIPMVIYLGIFCGLYAIYYSAINTRMDKFYSKLSNPWIRNLTGGLSLGIILFIFPSMYSVGYPVVDHVINGDFSAIAKGSVLEGINFGDWNLVVIAGGILLLKCWAVASTNSSGGVGGDFAPTLFAGSMAGFLFASLSNVLFGTHLPVASFGYIGMAGAMSGIIQAPLMTFFITVEMTHSYHFALPLAICAAVSYWTVKIYGLVIGNFHPLIIHHKWFSSHRPEPTVNSTK